MRCYANDRTYSARAWALKTRARAIMVVGALAVSAPLYADGLRIATLQPRLTAERLLLTGSIDITLTPKVEEALNNGIPLEFILEVRLHRRRALIWDETARSWIWRRELRYHALSGQYLVTNTRGADRARQSFQTLAEALAHAATLDESLALEATRAADAAYRVGMRIHLDIEALPPVLRPVAYTSRAWDLNSGWTMWTVQP